MEGTVPDSVKELLDSKTGNIYLFETGDCYDPTTSIPGRRSAINNVYFPPTMVQYHNENHGYQCANAVAVCMNSLLPNVRDILTGHYGMQYDKLRSSLIMAGWLHDAGHVGEKAKTIVTEKAEESQSSRPFYGFVDVYEKMSVGLDMMQANDLNVEDRRVCEACDIEAFHFALAKKAQPVYAGEAFQKFIACTCLFSLTGDSGVCTPGFLAPLLNACDDIVAGTITPENAMHIIATVSDLSNVLGYKNNADLMWKQRLIDEGGTSGDNWFMHSLFIVIFPALEKIFSTTLCNRIKYDLNEIIYTRPYSLDKKIPESLAKPGTKLLDVWNPAK